MSRRTLIKQWNPAVAIGTRGRGKRKPGDDPDRAFTTAFRTMHDPAVAARHGGGRDAPSTSNGARFYSASGLNSAGLPAGEDRFRAHTGAGRGSIRGGRGGGVGAGRAPQQRVGMFRNAIQSNVIFGEPSERVLRHSRRKIDRLIAPESDVAESTSEWRPTQAERNASRNRRPDPYEYCTEEEMEEEEEERDPRPRRRASAGRRTAATAAAPVQQHRRRTEDPDYDPFEFRDDDESAEEEAARRAPPPPVPRPRRSTSRKTAGAAAPTAFREPTAYARERLRANEERTKPRRLYASSEEEEEEEDDRQGRRQPVNRRREEPRRDHHSPPLDKRASKRAHERSPQLLQQPRRQKGRREADEEAAPAAASASTAAADAAKLAAARATTGFRFSGEDEDGSLAALSRDQMTALNYTPSITRSMARRVTSGLQPLRLREADSAQTYLATSRQIILGALDRFNHDDEEEGEQAEGGAGRSSSSSGDGGPGSNHGATTMRALLERTQYFNITEESEDEDSEDANRTSESAIEARGVFENIFSSHTSTDAPVLERLFEQTFHEDQPGVEADGEDEVDTAQMLGLAGGASGSASCSNQLQQQSFALVPVSGGGGGGRLDRSMSSSSPEEPFAGHGLFNRGNSNRSMALVLNGTVAGAAAAAMQPIAAYAAAPPPAYGSSGSSGSSVYSSDRTFGSTGEEERSFQFQMGSSGGGSSVAGRSAAPSYNFRTENNNGSFNFDF